MAEITEFPEINRGIQEAAELEELLGYSVAELEKLLSQPEYRIDGNFKFISKAERTIDSTVEKETGYGMGLSSMFEELCRELHRVPTQQEFNDASMLYISNRWVLTESYGKGIAWSPTVEKAVTNRNYRTYAAQINELHCVLLIKELFPEWKVFNSDDLDSVLGVDIVVETAKKRLYFHVFKNSPHSFKFYRLKEKRGGRRTATGKFVKFNRDFAGDKPLVYEGNTTASSASTKFINGLPLFKADWLKSQLLLFDNFDQFGEPLDETGKLQYLDEFLLETQEVTV